MWDFSQSDVKPATTKMNKVAVLTDGKTLTKVTLFEKFGDKIKEGNSYIIRGHEIRGREPPYYINITQKTMFFRTTNITVTEELREKAQALLCPKSTPTLLADCLDTNTFITVQGQVKEAIYKFFSSIKYRPLVLRW